MGEPMTTGLAIGAGTQLVGGLIGQDQANKDRRRANDLYSQALAQFEGINTPTAEDLQVALERASSAGTLSPEMIQAITLGDTALSNVSTDPRLAQAQMQSLDSLQQLANTGMTSADEAAYELARRNSASEAQAKQNQILQNMQQRGIGGSGSELAASLQNAQSSADRLQQAQLLEAQARQQARQQALTQAADLAGNIRSQDYGEQAKLAAAKDSIAQFNAQNQQNLNTLNTNARNNAQASNLTNAQNIRNTNTNIANQEQMQNKVDATQTGFNNARALAGDKAGMLTGQAGRADQQAANTAKMWTDMATGVGNMALKGFGK